MTTWACANCGGTNLWELSWVRTNRLSFLMEYDEDVHTYDDIWPQPQCKCDDCGEDRVHVIEKDEENI